MRLCLYCVGGTRLDPWLYLQLPMVSALFPVALLAAHLQWRGDTGFGQQRLRMQHRTRAQLGLSDLFRAT